MTAASSLVLVSIVETPRNRAGLLIWLCGMALALGLRCMDVLVWHRRRTRPGWHGGSEIRRYAAGVGAVGILWMLLPALFFDSLSPQSRVVAAVVFSAMAGGSAAVLGAAPVVAISYCLMLLVPFSVLFLVQPGRDWELLGSLGLVSFVIMAATCRVNYRAVIKALRLARQNEMLIERVRAAKVSLRDANQSLEARVGARTAELRREIVERQNTASALTHLASHDPLTGLLNRTALSDRLTRLLASADLPAAVLFLDLDRFKKINDVQGHGSGDQVLHAIAGRLAGICSEGDSVARWGGDEFVVVMAGRAGMDEAARMARTILDRIKAPMQIGERKLRIGGTIGIALYPEHGLDADMLIGAADLAMYSAKQDGGDCVAMFDRSLVERVTEQHLLEQGLRDAVALGALSLHYQPIFDAASGHCVVMEALLRWTHPERGPISPAMFIPVAEQSGLIGTIGRYVLREACLAALDWPPCSPGHDPPAVSVNVSVAQVLSGQFAGDVQEALDHSGLPVARLHLEITESMFAADHLRFVPVLEELRARGVHLALDDFGTGFSSLALLKTLPIDTIKIDKVFVQETGEAGITIIQAVLQIARALKLEVTAEGIETELQDATMRRLGATRLQGYLLSRPMPGRDVRGWLLSHSSTGAGERNGAAASPMQPEVLVTQHPGGPISGDFRA